MKLKMTHRLPNKSTLFSLLVACLLTACGGNSDTEVNIDPVPNDQPIANAGIDQTVNLASTVMLSAVLSSDDDSSDTLSYSWSLTTLPNDSVALLSSGTNVATTFIADVIGSYTIALTVNDGLIDSLEDTIVVVVSEAIAGSTAGILCNYNKDEFNDSQYVSYNSVVQWNCDNGQRALTSNGTPDHEVGEFPNAHNPNTITAQNVAVSYTLSPAETTSPTTLGGPAGATGYVLNGVKIDAGTAGSCDNSGNSCSLIDKSGGWSIEALGQTDFNFGTDNNNAHVQPGGAYHYHGMPEGFITQQGGDNTKMTIIGWAADGFPIYARYGYTTANGTTSTIKAMTGSYQLLTTISDTRPSADTYPLGTFSQDWEYVAGSGDLDECNGRVGATPEFPAGIYHYFATDTYPYFQRCVKGEVTDSGGKPPRG
jgi:hypothetical protein